MRNDNYFRFRLPAEMLKKLKAKSDKAGETVSHELRKIIKKYLDEK